MPQRQATAHVGEHPHMHKCATTGESEEGKALNEWVNSETFPADAQTSLHSRHLSDICINTVTQTLWSEVGQAEWCLGTQTRLTFRVQVDPTQIPLIFFYSQFFLTFRFLQKRQLWLIRPSAVCPSTSCLRHHGGGGIIDDGLTHSDSRSQMTNIWRWQTSDADGRPWD